MKKTFSVLLTVLSLTCFASIASAQTSSVPTVAPITKTTAARPPSAQQSKMKDCAAKYHAQNIPKNQYHSFMGTCLKGSTTAAAATAKPTSTPPSTVPTPAPMSTIAPAASTVAPSTNQQHP